MIWSSYLYDLRTVTCSLMVNEIENGFISPTIFEKLSQEEQKRLIEAIELSDKIGFMYNQFYHLGFNFFSMKSIKMKVHNTGYDVHAPNVARHIAQPCKYKNII